MRRRILLAAAVLAVLALVAGIEISRLLSDPAIFFLQNDAGADWIRADTPFSLKASLASRTFTAFELRFETAKSLPNAHLTVCAFRRYLIEFDDKPIDSGSEDLTSWQTPRDVLVPGPIAPGTHELLIGVFNQNARPCLLAYSRDLGIRTGPGWFVLDKKTLRPAVSASAARSPDEALDYPGVREAFVSLAPWLGGIFALCFAALLLSSRPSDLAEKASRWRITPARVRWILLAAWVVLAANNIWQVPAWTGHDLDAHLEYVDFIVKHHALPLANDGWQTFQSPLFYLLAAPVYALLSPHYGGPVLVKVLRVLPLLCGLAQIEIAYRAARAVFPEKEDLQILATAVAGLLPMQICISQAIGNEPLAGCLTAYVLLLCVYLLVEPARQRSAAFFVLLGLAWGLAILAKVTPLLIAPLVIGVIAVHCRKSGGIWQQGLLRCGLVLGTGFLVSGWYFLRNWAHFGKPFVSGWGPERGIVWWQDPSYRTWAQLTSFGSSLSRPIYGGVWSLWDALYSSLWLDGSVSGLAVTPPDFPWNLRWVLVGAWLGLVPMAFLLMSPITSWRKELRVSRNALLLGQAALAVYLAAIVDLDLRLPVYSTAKATYAVGLLPCFGLLAAAGAVPLLQNRYLRAACFSAIACWAVAAYLAYFSTDYYRGRGEWAPQPSARNGIEARRLARGEERQQIARQHVATAVVGKMTSNDL